MLDQQGRCCGRKLLVYRGGVWGSPLLFCCRCGREYDSDPPYAQRENWAWVRDGRDRFIHRPNPRL